MRICLLLTLIAVTACSGADAPASRSPTDPAATRRANIPVPVRTGDVHDFDFQVGSWTVHNRTLKVGDDGRETWVEFPSTVCMRQSLGGVVNIEETRFPTKGYSAIALRTFDLKKRQWSIYWIESRAGVVLDPVVGGFEGDRGEFYAPDDTGAEPVLYRFVWTRLGTDRARWEQASTSDGVAWKPNWVMEFRRTDDPSCARP